MLTPLEKGIIYIFQVLNVSQETIIGIMLDLKDNPCGQNQMIDFLKSSNPEHLTEEAILQALDDISSWPKDNIETERYYD